MHIKFFGKLAMLYAYAIACKHILQEQQQIKMLAEARERSLNASLAVFPSLEVLPAATCNTGASAGGVQQVELVGQAEKSTDL
jgi:hypothetical protein